MRCPLLVPCDCADGWDAAIASAADAVVLDLGPIDSHRTETRRNAAAMLARSSALVARPRLLVRVAALADDVLDDDLDAVMNGPAPDGILLPGVVGAVDIQHLAAKLAVREAERDLADGHVGIVAMVADTPRGVLAVHTVPGASRRLMALGWDPHGLARCLGIDARAGRRWADPCRLARDLAVTAAAAAGVPAIGGPMVDDTTPLKRICDAARRAGLFGLIAVAPDHVPVIMARFAA